MDDDSDPPLATAAPRSRPEATPPQQEKTPWAEVFGLDKLEEGIKGLFWSGVFLAILGGIGYGIYAGAVWVKEQYFDTAESVGQKAAKCWNNAKRDPGRFLGECAKLSLRADALKKREQAEQFCKDKGLKFKGTIGDQTECEP